MNRNELPKKIKNSIASEKVDFITKSNKKNNINQILPKLIFAIFFNGILVIFVSKFFEPYIKDGRISFSSIGIPIFNNIKEWDAIIIPAIFLLVFLGIGVGLFIGIIRMFFDKGDIYIGTEKKLITYSKGKIKTNKWDEFSGKITSKQKHNKGNLILELKQKVTKEIIVDEDIYEDINEELTSETIKMLDIRNVMNIENKCKYRIENSNETFA